MEKNVSLASNANKKTKVSALSLAYIAVTVTLLCASSFIIIPSVVPFTLHLFVIFFSLSLFDGAKSSFAVLIYILLGTVGLPIFNGLQSGIAVLASPTGGYIIGYLLITLSYWLITAVFTNKLIVKILAMLFGLILCYTAGTAWFLLVYSNQSDITVLAALGTCVLPFILPDLLKIALALFTSARLANLIKNK